jgi:hypothetical protein
MARSERDCGGVPQGGGSSRCPFVKGRPPLITGSRTVDIEFHAPSAPLTAEAGPSPSNLRGEDPFNILLPEEETISAPGPGAEFLHPLLPGSTLFSAMRPSEEENSTTVEAMRNSGRGPAEVSGKGEVEWASNLDEEAPSSDR